jgi:hypothetical protein
LCDTDIPDGLHLCLESESSLEQALVHEVDSQGNLQGQIGGSGCASVTLTLNPSQ